jgi:hypothetical protein
MGRPKNTRNQKFPVITLIGEGITEQYYFKHVRSLFNYRYSLKPYFFGITSLTDMDRKIAEAIEGGGIAICVFDTDVTQRVDAEKKKLNRLVKKYSRKENVIFCDSLPSVEYWFLLHYKHTNKHFNNSDAVERVLRKYLTNYEKTTLFLEKEKWVADLCADNKLNTAIERARDFSDDSPSYSNIYKAFDLFRK